MLCFSPLPVFPQVHITILLLWGSVIWTPGVVWSRYLSRSQNSSPFLKQSPGIIPHCCVCTKADSQERPQNMPSMMKAYAYTVRQLLRKLWPWLLPVPKYGSSGLHNSNIKLSKNFQSQSAIMMFYCCGNWLFSWIGSLLLTYEIKSEQWFHPHRDSWCSLFFYLYPLRWTASRRQPSPSNLSTQTGTENTRVFPPLSVCLCVFDWDKAVSLEAFGHS